MTPFYFSKWWWWSCNLSSKICKQMLTVASAACICVLYLKGQWSQRLCGNHEYVPPCESRSARNVCFRVATSQLDLNSLTFPDFFDALFPDFPWPHNIDLMGIAWNPEGSEEKFYTCNHWVFTKNVPRNQGQTLGHLSQIIFPDFPWLSTINI